MSTEPDPELPPLEVRVLAEEALREELRVVDAWKREPELVLDMPLDVVLLSRFIPEEATDVELDEDVDDLEELLLELLEPVSTT